MERQRVEFGRKRKKRSAAACAAAFIYFAVFVSVIVNIGANPEELTADLSEMIVRAAREETPEATRLLPVCEFDVKITVDKETFSVKSGGTVADALDKADVEFGDEDLINIGLGEELRENTFIVINRVEITEEVRIKTLDYATKYKEDNNYAIGSSEVAVYGEEGELHTVVQHTYVDGELSSSDIISEEVVKTPVDEVILLGTKPEPKKPEPIETPGWLEIGENGEPVSYSKIFTGKACAYTAPAGAKTASGRTVKVGHVAVDPDIIPYGTQLYIVSVDGARVYGYAVAADTGSDLRNGKIIADLFMDTRQECIEWGARQVNVYVLD